MSDRLLDATAEAAASVLVGIDSDAPQGRLREEILALLAAPRKTLSARIAELERVAHEPYDFSPLVKRLERLEHLTPPPGTTREEFLTKRLAERGEALEKLKSAMQEACDLLAERTYGNSARSPGHNARLRLETAIRGCG